MPRPERLVLVAGTATEVGKTWVAAEMARALRARGLAVATRKPVQSHEPGAGPTDAEVLAGATGEDPDEVCDPTRSYGVAMAPPMAADVLGIPAPGLDALVSSLRWPVGVDVGLVESVGGVRSPIASDGDTVDLAERVAPDVVVLVADAGLGTINAVRLCASALDGQPLVVLLNRFDPTEELHRRNLEWLTAREGLDVIVDAAGVTRRHPDWCARVGGSPSTEV